MTPFVSIVIPVYNEEEYIVENTINLYKYLNNLNYRFEIILVNDGSKDKSLDYIKEISEVYSEIFVLDNKINRGKGHSVKKGMLFAKGDYVFFTDADLSTPVYEITNAINIMLQNTCDILIGTRSLSKGANIVKKQPIYRTLMGHVFGFFRNSIVPLNNIKDTQCGFKCFKKEIVYPLFINQTMEGFSFDVEILYMATLSKYEILEIPVTWINNENSKVNPITDSIFMFRDLWIIRRRHYPKRDSVKEV